jgi:hypothetical protein
MRRWVAIAIALMSWLTLRETHEVWQGLGGLVSERLRWAETFGSGVAVVVGYAAWALVHRRGGARRGTVRRYLVVPPAGVAAAVLVALRMTGRDEPIMVAVGCLLGYVAGASTRVAREAWSDRASGEPRRGEREREEAGQGFVRPRGLDDPGRTNPGRGGP